MRRISIRRWLSTPVDGTGLIVVADVLFALAVSAFAIPSALGLEGSNVGSPNAGWPAAIAVLTMTVPVVAVRRWPVAATAALAIGAALNWLVIGHLVRCGAGLIAVFYCAFAIGAQCRVRPAIAGVVLLTANITCQGYSDPKLSAGAIGTVLLSVQMIPVAVAFVLAGWLVGSRNALVAKLRASTVELRRQREENAQLAVATEQARIAGDLDGFLAERVGRISSAAATGQAVLATSPDAARSEFATIGEAGRSALNRMRDVVAGLQDAGAAGLTRIEPAPVLAQLDRLLADGGEGTARLTVCGDPRLLPPGVELSAYRIIERLLEAMSAPTDRAVEVTVAFEPHDLQLTVVGPPMRRGDSRQALAAAAERAAIHGGTISTSTTDRRRTTVVALPLVASRV